MINWLKYLKPEKAAAGYYALAAKVLNKDGQIRELQKEVRTLGKGLRSIKRHMETTMPTHYQKSQCWLIASAALGELVQRDVSNVPKREKIILGQRQADAIEAAKLGVSMNQVLNNRLDKGGRIR